MNVTHAQAVLRLADCAGFDLPDDLRIVPYAAACGSSTFWVHATLCAGAAAAAAAAESDPGGLRRWRLASHGLFAELVEPAGVDRGTVDLLTAFASCDVVGDADGVRAAEEWRAAAAERGTRSAQQVGRCAAGVSPWGWGPQMGAAVGIACL